MAVQFRLDPDVNALYIEIKPGCVARTIELTDSVYVDVDAVGTPLGVEFVNADEFIPFLRAHADDPEFPTPIRALFRPPAA